MVMPRVCGFPDHGDISPTEFNMCCYFDLADSDFSHFCHQKRYFLREMVVTFDKGSLLLHPHLSLK
jgi:hypothetical protein